MRNLLTATTCNHQIKVLCHILQEINFGCSTVVIIVPQNKECWTPVSSCIHFSRTFVPVLFFLLNSQNNYLSSFQEMSQQKPTTWALLILLSIFQFWQDGERKNKNPKRSTGFRAAVKCKGSTPCFGWGFS